MERRFWSALFIFALIGAYGCSKPAASDAPLAEAPAGEAANSAEESAGPALTPEQIAAREQLRPFTDSPQKAVHEFLSAVQIGNDERAGLLLTDLALQKTSERDMVVAPPGSPTAKFAVTDVEFVTEDKTGAHVFSTWTDFDPEGQSQQDVIVWILRAEEYGWRIAGMATTIFEGEPPLILNFEDPDDMLRKQELAQQEIARRAELAEQQAAGQQPPAAGTPLQAQQPAAPTQPATR